MEAAGVPDCNSPDDVDTNGCILRMLGFLCRALRLLRLNSVQSEALQQAWKEHQETGNTHRPSVSRLSMVFTFVSRFEVM